MKFKAIAAFACVASLFAAASMSEAADRGRHWCRHLQNSDSPMTWSEGYGVATCNDRASTPYRPWNSAAPIRRNQSDPMVARTDWRIGNCSAFDNRYDDRYDRRSHRYR